MLVKILEDRTPEDRCSVCGSDKSVKYYFIDKEGNRKLLCNKCALTYNPVEESSIEDSSKEHYIVTMTDYRSANAAYIPVGSEDMRKALIKEDVYVGSYPDIETATIFIYKKIETLFGNINTNLPYKINIEVSIYPDKNQKMFYVSVKGQIQVIFKIEKENMFIHRNMINSVYGATGAEQSISAGSCYITHDGSNGSVRIDYIYLDTNKCVSSELFKTDAYTLLYTINEYADIFTHFYDLRDRKKTKDTLTIVLTGRFPERDNYDPFNTSYIEAYVGEGDISNFMLNYIKVYNGKYELGDEKFIKRIMNEINSINIPIDNVYIIDKRLLPEEKEDKSSKEKKAISCEIKPSFASKIVKEYNGVMVSYEFNDNEGKTEYYKSLDELITNLKKYTDIFTKFTDKRYGDLESDDEDFALLKIDYNIIYCYYTIAVYINNSLKYMRTFNKNKPEINSALENALDLCRNHKFFIVSNAGVEKPNSSSTNVDEFSNKPEVDEEEKEHEKAIECIIRISDDYNNDSTLMIFKFKTDGNCSIKSLSKVSINTEDFIRYLKQYTDGHTKFIDERVGPSWIAFYSRISYECHIIEMDADNITLKHYDHSNGTMFSNYKTERKCFEEVLDQIKDANIIYIRDETAWCRVEKPNSSSTNVDIDSDYNSLLGL